MFTFNQSVLKSCKKQLGVIHLYMWLFKLLVKILMVFRKA